MNVPETLLQSLVAQLDGGNTIGIALAGSLAHRTGNRYSDVDLQHFVRVAPESKQEANSLRFVDGFLVSIHTNTLEEETAGLRQPQRAIWVVPGLRQARILLDKDGSLAGLIEAARAFRWEQIAPAAKGRVSWQLCALAEEVYKLLGALEKQDESKALYALFSLVFDLAEALLVAKGVLVPSENRYFELAQQTAGLASDWTRHFRLAMALDPLPAGEPPFAFRARAGIALYRQTASLLATCLQPEHAEVVWQALATAAQAGCP